MKNSTCIFDFKKDRSEDTFSLSQNNHTLRGWYFFWKRLSLIGHATMSRNLYSFCFSNSLLAPRFSLNPVKLINHSFFHVFLLLFSLCVYFVHVFPICVISSHESHFQCYFYNICLFQVSLFFEFLTCVCDAPFYSVLSSLHLNFSRNFLHLMAFFSSFYDLFAVFFSNYVHCF